MKLIYPEQFKFKDITVDSNNIIVMSLPSKLDNNESWWVEVADKKFYKRFHRGEKSHRVILTEDINTILNNMEKRTFDYKNGISSWGK